MASVEVTPAPEGQVTEQNPIVNDPYGRVKKKSKLIAATTADAKPAQRPPITAPSNTGTTSASAAFALMISPRTATSAQARTMAPSTPVTNPMTSRSGLTALGCTSVVVMASLYDRFRPAATALMFPCCSGAA